MDRSNLNRPAHSQDISQGIMGEWESAKNALLAVDGKIEGLLSRTPAPAATDGDIPILDDVVSDRAAESSADAQLSLTNKYKTLSERDLENAMAASVAEAAEFEPPLAARPEEQDLMLQLDELLIDDELFDLDMAFDLDDSLENLALEPDMPTTSSVVTNSNSSRPDIPPVGPPDDAQPDVCISSPARIDVADNCHHDTPPTEPRATPLEPEQLTQLIDHALEAQIPALKQSLFEHLEPLLCPQPSRHN
jgi:hypothetical protein